MAANIPAIRQSAQRLAYEEGSDLKARAFTNGDVFALASNALALCDEIDGLREALDELLAAVESHRRNVLGATQSAYDAADDRLLLARQVARSLLPDRPACLHQTVYVSSAGMFCGSCHAPFAEGIASPGEAA